MIVMRVYRIADLSPGQHSNPREAMPRDLKRSHSENQQRKIAIMTPWHQSQIFSHRPLAASHFSFGAFNWPTP
jgi:hypothetical protein